MKFESKDSWIKPGERPLVRAGFKRWVDDGLPRDPDTGAVDRSYLDRGRDRWLAVSWDDAFALSAAALVDIARTYTGADGQRRLLAQGYDPLMVEATRGAGTQVLKFRGGMPPLGMTRIFAQYRLANSMALLDDQLRGTGPDGALGGRGWDNYSWHTDLPPGHPMVTGQQTVDFDLCNVEHARLALVWGMNWITTKMPDAHWLTEARMKGTKVVVIAAEYSATSCKADARGVAACPSPTGTPKFALRTSATSDVVYLTDRACREALALQPKADGASFVLDFAQERRVTGVDADGEAIYSAYSNVPPLSTGAYAPEGLTPAVGLGFSLAGCTGDTQDEACEPVQGFKLWTIVDSITDAGVTLFKVENLPDCRYNPAPCRAALDLPDPPECGGVAEPIFSAYAADLTSDDIGDGKVIYDPDGTGYAAAQFLNVQGTERKAGSRFSRSARMIVLSRGSVKDPCSLRRRWRRASSLASMCPFSVRQASRSSRM